MKVWVVAVSDCEANHTVAICSTKKLAKRELFKKRDELIKEWQESYEFFKKENREDNYYLSMIKNLSGDNYKDWDNYPQERPYIYEMEIISK